MYRTEHEDWNGRKKEKREKKESKKRNVSNDSHPSMMYMKCRRKKKVIFKRRYGVIVIIIIKIEIERERKKGRKICDKPKKENCNRRGVREKKCML